MFIFESCHALCGKRYAETECFESEMLKFWVSVYELSMGKDLGTRISVKMQATGSAWLCNAAGARAMDWSLTLIAPSMFIYIFERLRA